MTVGPREQRALYDTRRHLGSLGVQTQFTARGDALKGEVTFAGDQVLRDPAGGRGIERIRFTVAADGSLRVDDPPSLSDLPGLPPARKIPSLDGLSAAIRQALDRRFGGLRAQSETLRGFGLKVTTDPERMVLVARLELDGLGEVVIESEGARFVARQLVYTGGQVFDFPGTRVDLDRFGDRTDLELFLSAEAEQLVPDHVKQVLVSGHHAVPQETELFGELTEEVSDIVSGLTPPLVDQTWVMDVIVEADDGREVRYRGVGFTGQAFGAPRVLPKPAFDAAYTRSGQSHRMLVKVTHMGGESVGYVKLDGERRPEGGDRKVSLIGFLANFTQEPDLG